MKALYINKEGKVQYIADLPEEPKVCMAFVINSCLYTACACKPLQEAYEKALQAAKDSAVDCSDQKMARKIICDHYTYFVHKDTIHPFPEDNYSVEVVGMDETGNSNCSDNNVVREVAVITPKKEEPKQEENQERIFDDMFCKYFDLRHEQKMSGYHACLEIQKQFTITRKQ